jgi:hypothetical protein
MQLPLPAHRGPQDLGEVPMLVVGMARQHSGVSVLVAALAFPPCVYI